MRLWGELDPDPLLLVCANGRRDRCCGHSGGRLADTLWRGAHRDRVLTCTHLGGHRFAPTALLLPAGALHGRLDEESGTDLLAGAAQGRMRYDTLRGFSQLAPAAQVADVHARARHGYLGTTALQIDLVPGPGPEHQQARAHIPDTHRPPIDRVVRPHPNIQPNDPWLRTCTGADHAVEHRLTSRSCGAECATWTSDLLAARTC